jgi:hypothetical protein
MLSIKFKKNTLRFFDTLVNIYQSARHNITEPYIHTYMLQFGAIFFFLHSAMLSCRCQQYKTVEYCHENATMVSMYIVVELQKYFLLL